MNATVEVEAPTVYRIPDQNLDDLNAKFAKLVARADKLGVEPPTLTVVGTDETTDESGAVQGWTLVTVAGEPPKFAGWSLTATIELDHDGDMNVVRAVPGAATDPAWRTMSERCDHCHVDSRGRLKLIAVTHDDGHVAVVGSTCLRDFLGHQSPEALAAYASWLTEFDPEDFTDPDKTPGSREELRVEPVTFLGWTIRSMAEHGWVSRGVAWEYDRTATADDAFGLWLLASGRVRPARNEVRPAPLTDTEKAEAAAVLAYGMSIDPAVDNDYLANLRAVAAKTGWNHGHIGVGASMVTAYRREQGRLIERKARAAAAAGSEHFGAEKQRLELTGTVTFVREYPGDYGTRAMVKLTTTDGNVAVWWASDASNAPAQGDVVTGKATVKRHDTYEGVAQTEVTRFAWSHTADSPGRFPWPCAAEQDHLYGRCGCNPLPLVEVDGQGEVFDSQVEGHPGRFVVLDAKGGTVATVATLAEARAAHPWTCACRGYDPADPCGHGDTSEGCPVHDPQLWV